jgi:drug/metabolite transporter (DMT)-like permease
MLLGSVFFAAMGAAVKWAARDLSSYLVVFARSLTIIALAWAALRLGGQRARVRNKRLLLWRSATGFVAMACYFYALSAVPMSIAVTIQYSSPIFVALLSGLTIGERVGGATWVGVLSAFGGVAVLVSPDPANLGPGALAALASAILAAFAYLAIRELRRTDSPEIIVLYFALFSTALSAPSLVTASRVPSASELAALLAVGVFAFGGQMLITHAYRHGRAAFISGLSYSTIAFSALLGAAFFDEALDATAVSGMALIAGSGVWLSWAEVRHSQSEARPRA